MKRSRNPLIVGYEVLTPLGMDFTSTWERALNGLSGIGKIDRFPLTGDFPVQQAGQIPVDIHSEESFRSPFIVHGLHVVDSALKASGISMDAFMANRTAVTFTSSIGGLESLLGGYLDPTNLSLVNNLVRNLNVHQVACSIGNHYRLQGPLFSPVGACASGNMSLALGACLIREGMADLVICGAVDFPLIEILVEAFATMNGAIKYLEPVDRAFSDPALASRPFSLDRRGFVISEGAACLLLASPELAKDLPKGPRIELAGIGMNSDAHHFVSPHLPTVAGCMKSALQDAGIPPERIDYINAHAASTKIGDQIELQAIHEVFGGRQVPTSSNKSQLGHTMGASSAIESAFCCKGLEDQLALPTINYLPDPKWEIDCIAEGPRRLKMEYVMNNSFGFGGSNCCLVFRRDS